MSRARRGLSFMQTIAMIAAFVFLVCIALIALNNWEANQDFSGSTPNQDPPLVHNGQEYVLKDNVETILVMGLDKYEHADEDEDGYYNDQQADFLMLFVLDHEAKTYETIHVDRDTMAEINVLGLAGQKIGTVTKQIALSHTYGNGRAISCRNTSDAVSNLLMDMKIDSYISMTMNSLPVFNDLVGGVEVTILDDFTGIDDTLIKGETMKLLGEQALNYVRSRYGLDDSSNEDRMLRQRQYLEALFDTTAECVAADENFIVDASTVMAQYMVSDLSLTELQETFKNISDYTEVGAIRAIEGEYKVGNNNFMEFHVNAESIKQIVIDVFYEPKTEQE